MYKLKKKTPTLKKGAVLVKHEKSDNFVPHGMEQAPLVDGFYFTTIAVTKMKQFFAPATEKDLKKFGKFYVSPKIKPPPPVLFRINTQQENVMEGAQTKDKAVSEGGKSADFKRGRLVGYTNGIPIEDMRYEPINVSEDDIKGDYDFDPFSPWDQRITLGELNRRMDEARRSLENAPSVMSIQIFIGHPPNHKLLDVVKLPGQGEFSLFLGAEKAYQISQEVRRQYGQ